MYNVYRIVYSPDSNNSFQVDVQNIYARNEIHAIKTFFNRSRNDEIAFNDIKSVSLLKKN